MDGDRESGKRHTERGTEARSDDYVLPFQLERAAALGRLARLGPAADEILTRHAYPEPVSQLLAEAVTLTAMLGVALKFEGKFTLQIQSNGPVSFLVVHFTTPGHLRAYAGFDKTLFERRPGAGRRGRLLGEGHLAMTMDAGTAKERYQGIVALAGGSLADAASEYFAQSEQIPAFIKIAVARHWAGAAGRWSWRAGGLMVQKLTSEGGRPLAGPEGALASNASDDEGWRRAEALAATVEDHELLDPELAPERLLYRLFHQEQARVFAPRPLDAECTCSRERVEQMLKQFAPEELSEMADGNVITVTCEFCNTRYGFGAAAYLPAGGNIAEH